MSSRSRRWARNAARAEPKADWWVAPRSEPEPDPEPLPAIPERPEEDVRLACELTLFFMLLKGRNARFCEGDDENDSWWVYCQNLSCEYPTGSYSQMFFWAMRLLGDPKETLESFREYLAWKWEDVEAGRLPRIGPRWV